VIDVTPAQPEDVVDAIEALIVRPAPGADPWWQAGVEETLYGDATARPRSTLGADLA
jgi:hypothetical protein